MPKVRVTARKAKEGAEDKRRKELERQEALERRLAAEREDAVRQEAAEDEGQSEASSLPGDRAEDLPEEELRTGKRSEVSSYNFTAEQEEKLVTFFAENSCFWDKRDQNFMNKQVREKKAAAIAKELGCDSE